MKLNKKQLPFYAAIVQTIQYAVAGYLLLEWIGFVSVGAMGALVSLSMAYAASQVADIAKGRKLQSYLALIGLMILSPILVGTATFYHLTIITNPVWRGVVAGVWGIIPDGAVALAGFVAGKGLVEREESRSKPAKAKKKPALAEPEPAKFWCNVAGCQGNPKTTDGSFGTQSALNGHQRKHKPIAYAVSLVEPVTKESVSKKASEA